MVSQVDEQETQQTYSPPKGEKILFAQTFLSLERYLAFLTEILPSDDENLKVIKELLRNNDQIDNFVLYRSFRLVEGILLWHLHQGNRGYWENHKYSPEYIEKLLTKLTRSLNEWDGETFRSNASARNPQLSRNHYGPAAQMIVATSGVVFASLRTLSSPDVSAATVRAALSILDETQPDANYLASLLKKRAEHSGAKADTGEDAFYAALTKLVAGWSDSNRKIISKQLGDMLAMTADQNEVIVFPISENMIILANLLLAAIGEHDQNAADFADAESVEQKRNNAAHGAELGSEQFGKIIQQLQNELEKTGFSHKAKEIAKKVFESLIIELRMINPAVILAIVETYGNQELREAFTKSYTRRGKASSETKVDDVLMFVITGTFFDKLSHQVHNLAEFDLGWVNENLNATGFTKILARIIKLTAKFGLHQLKGTNSLPQALVLKPHITAVTANENVGQQADDVDLSRTQAVKIQPPKDLSKLPRRADFVANRQELSGVARESIKIRLGRFLEAESALWESVLISLGANRAAEAESAQAIWGLSFVSCINSLNEPTSELFCVDPRLIKEFVPVLAQRLVTRYAGISGPKFSGDLSTQKLRTFITWTINQSAGHWGEAMTEAVLRQITITISKDDSQYFTGLISGLTNAIGKEKISQTEGEPAKYRERNRKIIIKTLVQLIVEFSSNDNLVGTGARNNLISLLTRISGNLSDLIEAWNESKEYIYKYRTQSPERARAHERDAAILADLLNTLAGHTGLGEIRSGSAGQIEAAMAINVAIGREIGILIQTEMPSQTLMENLLKSREKLAAQDRIVSEKTKEIRNSALDELKIVVNSSSDGKLTLAAIVELINNSLKPLGEVIGNISQFRFKLPESVDQATSVDTIEYLANLTRQYLSNQLSPELNPLGYALAGILQEQFKHENLALAPIEDLRAKLALVLKDQVSLPLQEAVKLDAETAAAAVLAESMDRYFKSADLLMAIKNSRLSKEDLQELEDFMDRIREVRQLVISTNGQVEKNLKNIRKNLGKILGAATHLIRMPAWEDIAWFLNDDIFTAIQENKETTAAKKTE